MTIDCHRGLLGGHLGRWAAPLLGNPDQAPAQPTCQRRKCEGLSALLLLLLQGHLCLFERLSHQRSGRVLCSGQ